MKAPPLVSVAMPTYNRAAYLAETLQSILAQDFTDFELVVVNNGCTDGSGEILARFAGQDSRVRLITHPTNVPVLAVHNALPGQCRGKFLVFAGDDDPWKSHRLGTLVNLMGPQAAFSAVYTDWEEINASGEPFRSSLTHPMPATSHALGDLFTFARHGDVRLVLGLIHRSLLLDREFFRAIAPDMGWFADGYFFYHLLSAGPVAYSPQKTYFKRWENQKGYQADYREEATYLKTNQQLLWAGGQIFSLLAQTPVPWPRRRVTQLGFAWFFYARLLHHTRAYGWQFSRDPKNLRRFVQSLGTFCRQQHLRRGAFFLWALGALLPWLRRLARLRPRRGA